MLIFGTKFFGQVDSIDDRIHIATRFHHCFLFPLIYLGTYIVIDNARALRVSINFKSILFAYFRLLLGVIAILASLTLIIMLSSTPLTMQPLSIAAAALGVIGLSLYVARLSFRWARASEASKVKMMALLERDKAKIVILGPMQVRPF